MARSPSADPPGRGGSDGEGRSPWLRKVLSGAIGAAALFAFAAVLMHAYGEGRSSWTGRATAVIKADPGPYKVKPESPGGRSIPDRDKRIYDRIQAAPAADSVERLLPLPEAPIPPADPRPAKPEPPPPAVAAADKVEARPEAQPAPAQQTARAVEPPKPPKPAKPPAAAKGKYRLQIAALRSTAAAGRATTQLRNRHGKILSGLRLAIEKKDLGPPKGVYYRLLAGPVKDRETARRLCAALAKRNVGCLVVQR